MQIMRTPNGITLETLRRHERDAAAAVTLASAGALALIGAGALCAACLRGCASAPAPAYPAACYEANWSRGVYGDEMCGFIPKSGSYISNGFYFVRGEGN